MTRAQKRECKRALKRLAGNLLEAVVKSSTRVALGDGHTRADGEEVLGVVAEVLAELKGVK